MNIELHKNDYYQFFSLSNICFVCVKEMSQGDSTALSQGDVSFNHTKRVYIDSIIQYFINRSYSLNPLCLKFILNKRVF